MQATKDKIKSIVSSYIQDFPKEYADFRQYNREKQDNSTDFAETGADYIERGIWEMPEVCLNLIKLALSDEEWTWFQSKKGARWIATTYPDFRMSHRV